MFISPSNSNKGCEKQVLFFPSVFSFKKTGFFFDFKLLLID